MAYNENAGPFVPFIGRYDTFANLLLGRSATSVGYGTTAYCDDAGLVYSDKTSWRKVISPPTNNRQSLTSGASGTVSSGVSYVFLNGVNTTYTLTLPVPIDGDVLYINAITAVSVSLTLTATSPATAFLPASPPSTLAAGVGLAYVYDSASTKWMRLY
jgi:hypothetical protein